jgi:glycosyltransferase involved in cell wall biosynthesis
MTSKSALSFIVCVSDLNVLEKTLFSSPIFREGHPHEIITMMNSASASLAYNEAMDNAKNDLLVFCHQDVYFPEGWDIELINIIKDINKKPKWGVLGCYGISLYGEAVGHTYSNGLGRELGMQRPPVRVQSLDEFVLIMRKSNGLKFDRSLRSFHLFGTDICLEAEKLGFINYSISNYCIHNSISIKWLPCDFWNCAEYLRDKWKGKLPVKTCCVVINPSRLVMLITRISSCLSTLISLVKKNRIYRKKRLDDPSILVKLR